MKTSEGREEIVPRFGRFEAFKFTSASKQALMEGLAVAIQQKHITFPAGPIQAELEAFEYVYERTGVRYSAPSGLHDDCVMALALAVARWQKVDRHTGDDWMRLLTAGARKRTTPDTDTSDAYEDDERPIF